MVSFLSMANAVVLTFFIGFVFNPLHAIMLSRVYHSGPIKLSANTTFYFDADPSTDIIHFALIVNDSDAVKLSGENWLGIGIGEPSSGSMVGADIVTAEFDDNVNDSCTITDRYVPFTASPLRNPPSLFPEPDECSESDWNLIACSRNETSGVMVLEVNRSLSVTDVRQDRTILPGLSSILGAYGKTFEYHGANRQSAKIKLFGDEDINELRGLPNNINGHVEIRAKSFQVPTSATTYACTSDVVPLNKVIKSDISIVEEPAMIIAVEPVINDEATAMVQHISLFLCSGESYASSISQTKVCNDNPYGPLGFSESGCTAMIYAYSRGTKGYEFPQNVGFVADTSRKFLVMETIYSNPTGKNGTFDTSGVRVHYTYKLRVFQAGSLMLGDPLMSRADQLVVTDEKYQHTCPESCTTLFNRSINVINSYSYMRSSGKSMYTNLFRKNGQFIQTISKVNFWNQEFISNRPFVPALQIQRGHRLQTTCQYDVSKNEGTKFGLSRKDEICVEILMYWPLQKSSVDINVCGYEQNKNEDNEISGNTVCGDGITNIGSDEVNPMFDDTIGAPTEFGKFSAQCPAPSKTTSETSSPEFTITPSGTSSPGSSVTPSGLSSPGSSVTPSGLSSPGSSVTPSGTSSPGSSVSPSVSQSESGSSSNGGESATPSAASSNQSSSASASSSSQGGGGTEGSEAACFDAASTVILKSGKHVRMSELQVGNEVLVAPGVFSVVFMFSHSDAHVRSAFFEITTKSNNTLTVSPGHIVPINELKELKHARHIVVGDRLGIVSSSFSSLQWEQVMSIRLKHLKGLYNPQTMQSNIIVNRVLATTFTDAVKPISHDACLTQTISATALLAPLRWINLLFNVDPSVILT